MDEQQQDGIAAGAVFYTAELLEHILKFLSMRDLLLIQRVCSQWRDLIKQSPELQQNLFFLPREATNNWLYTREPDEDAEKVYHSIQKVASDCVVEYTCDDEFTVASGELNPLLFTVRKEDTGGTVIAAACEGCEIFHSRRSIGSLMRSFEKHPDGSWQRMLLTQPPIRNWGYESKFEDGCVEQKYTTTDFDIKIKHIFDQLLLDQKKHEEPRRKHHFSTMGMVYPAPEELAMEQITEDGWEEYYPEQARRTVREAGSKKMVPAARPLRS